MTNLFQSLSSGEKWSDDRLQLEDVFIQILVHFLVRSLLRFRCVSKYWCGLIKSPKFVDKHLLKHWRFDGVLLVRRYLPPPEDQDVLSFHDPTSLEMKQVISIPFLNYLRVTYNEPYLPESIYLLGPYNGILCLSCIGNYSLCNPALRELKPIPPCPFVCPKGFREEIFADGFGGTCTDDFKVVVIRRITLYDDYDPQNYIIIHLYIQGLTYGEIFLVTLYISIKNLCNYPCSELLFNGNCHWNANTTGFSSPDTIVTFNISTDQVFGLLGFIPDWEEELYGYSVSLVAINNCLGMVRHEAWLNEPQLIGHMGDERLWCRRIVAKTFVIGPYQVICPLMSWMNDEWLLVERYEGELAACAIHTNETKRLQIYGIERSLRSITLKESLISLNKVIQETPMGYNRSNF